jgi:hypothetical protein
VRRLFTSVWTFLKSSRLFGEPRMLDIWPALSQSPILQRFTWSPLIVDTYDRNRDSFESKTHRSPIPDALSETDPAKLPRRSFSGPHPAGRFSGSLQIPSEAEAELRLQCIQCIPTLFRPIRTSIRLLVPKRILRRPLLSF